MDMTKWILTLSIFLFYAISPSLSQEASDCPNSSVIFDANSDQIIGNSPLSGNTDFTVEFWIKLPPTTSNGIRKPYKTIGAGVEIVEIGGTLRLIDPQASTNYIVPFSINIRDGLWHHVALVKRNNDMTVYLDSSTYTYSTNSLSTFDMPAQFKLGRTSESVSASLRGEMDEFRIWSDARTVSEIYDFKNTE